MSSKGKTFAIAGVIVGVAVLALGAATNWFSNWSKFSKTADDVKSWVTGGSSSSSAPSSSAAPATSASADGKVQLAAADTYIHRVQNADGTFTHSNVKLTATVNSDASIKTIAWSFAWADASVTASVTDYFSIVSQTDTTTGGYCYVSSSKPFSAYGLVNVTAKTVDGTSASVGMNYYNSVDVFKYISVSTSRWEGNLTYATGSNSDGTGGIYYYKESAPFTIDFCMTFETDNKTTMPGFMVANGYKTLSSTYVAEFYALFQTFTNFDKYVFSFTSFSMSYDNANAWWTGYVDVTPNSGSVTFTPNFTIDGESATLANGSTMAKYVAASNLAVTTPSSQM